MSEEQTDQTDQDPWSLDLIVGHPFKPAGFHDAWPGICGHLVDGWPCGYDREEHADQGEMPDDEEERSDPDKSLPGVMTPTAQEFFGGFFDGDEPDRAAEYERHRRERQEGATEEETP